MFGASLYIIVCSSRNRIVRRLRRLREPRYLIGAVVGVAYLYFSIFARMRGAAVTRRGRVRTPPSLAAALATLPPAGVGGIGAGLLLIAALTWIFPTDSGLIDFSEAETDFLFPAPVTRRQLLTHRLIRSQLPLLFGAVVSSIFVPFAAMAERVRFAAGVFIVLSAIRVYFTGVTLARARLTSASATVRRMAWAPLAVIVVAVGVVGVPIWRAIMTAPPGDPGQMLTIAGGAVTTGPAAIVLWPFAALVRPLFAGSGAQFFSRLGGAFAVLAVLVAWVLRSDEAFQEVAAEATVRTARTKAGGQAAPRVRATAWLLPLSGRTESVFFWKNGMQTLRAINVKTVIPFIPFVLFSVGAATLRMSATGARGPAAALCIVALMLAGFSTLLGPQTVRSDLRGDLRHIDLLKTWPVKAAALVRGEMLWPTSLLTLCAWFALACGTILSTAAFPNLTTVWRLSLCAAAFLLAPALIVAQFTIHNAAAILFPAWIPIGNQRPRGLDMMGQRLIMFAAVLLALVVMVGPGAIAGAIIWLAFHRLIDAAALVPAATVCLGIVCVEVMLVTEALGPAYDRIDLSDVELGE